MTDSLPPDAPRIGAGRPPIEVTEKDLDQITSLAGYGMTQAAMAVVLGWSPETFARRKRDDPRILTALATGQAVAEAKVGEALFLKATGQVKIIEQDGEKVRVYLRPPETSAIRWYEMTRCGRADRVREVDPEEDYPGMNDILGMTTEQKIAELTAIVDAGQPQANGKSVKNGKKNGAHGSNGKRARR